MAKRVVFPLLASLVVLSLNVASAQPQDPLPASNEVIVRSDGQAVYPWVFGSTCVDGGASCGQTLINQETQEIAIMKDQLAGAFVRVGNGVEIQRKGELTTMPEEQEEALPEQEINGDVEDG